MCTSPFHSYPLGKKILLDIKFHLLKLSLAKNIATRKVEILVGKREITERREIQEILPY